MTRKISTANTLTILLILLIQINSRSQDHSKYFSALKWRMIGPHRGGRTVGAVGVPQQPNVFYIGVNNGGVWKTTDYGRTWNPIFDEQSTGSIGDVAVAPSNPNVIYVGSGEGLQRPDLSVGDGMYKSIDAGKTWKHIGLEKVQQIGGLTIDPTDENIVYVAALGHPYGPNTERGVYKTTDGGQTWNRVLYIDENTGAIQVTVDPNNPKIIFADLWAGRMAPWENGTWNGKESGLFKSTDAGLTWKKITNGLPTTAQGLGRIGFCIAPSDSKRMYATVDAGKEGGIYRSDDAGENWYRIQTDERFWGRGFDFAELKVDPKNPDIIYDANVVTWKSTDGGKSWNAFRGAPGGDDYHRVWINPQNTDIILIASDQGAIITVNGGKTFSSWYNQPTAQFYHVSADNAFPYNVYSGQQESGSIGIASRGNDGEITFREWHSVAAQEYGYVVADPMNPDIIYGGKISRFNKRTGQVQDITPDLINKGNYRFIRTAPVLFNPIDHKTLYYAGNVIFKTLNGGNSWTVISSDLTRKSWDVPQCVGIYTDEALQTRKQRGVIYTVAPSYIDINTIWCGTDDGLIHVTRNSGKTWSDVTPNEITAWSKISLMDASHYDVNTVYAAVNRIRCDDMHPHIYKTKNGGKTWTEIVNGLPNDPINVVREDPKRKGLLYAGSERAVYVSFDEGEHWESLRLNMPCTSIRDLIIKDDDLVIATHGRSFWILDDITSLRQLNTINTNATDILFKPQTAYRVRWNMNTDTPLPQEEPAGQNPPDGAVIDYYLNDDKQEIKLEIFDSKNKLVRSYSSKDTMYAIPELNIPLYWIRPQHILSSTKGAHRFTWDMHYAPLNVAPSYPIGATYENTMPAATAPWALPGVYTVKLHAGGKTQEQHFTLKMDPRVKTSKMDLIKQYQLSMQCYHGRKQSLEIIAEIETLKNKLKSDLQKNSKTISELDQLENGIEKSNDYSFSKLQHSFAFVFDKLEECDCKPTKQSVDAVAILNKEMNGLKLKWKAIKNKLN